MSEIRVCRSAAIVSLQLAITDHEERSPRRKRGRGETLCVLYSLVVEISSTRATTHFLIQINSLNPADRYCDFTRRFTPREVSAIERDSSETTGQQYRTGGRYSGQLPADGRLVRIMV